MTYLILLLVIALVLSAETVRRMINDGQGPQRPPVSHFDDPRFHAPRLG